MKMKQLFTTILATGLLSGCSENGFFFHSNSDYADDEAQGVYYIGEPYQIKGVLYTPAEDMNYSEKGVATWYTRDSQNRLTTNGELFDDELMTAAHKTLPLPSIVRITNLENGDTAIVRVNDRGPAVNNRLIDVSKKVAEVLEMPETGTVKVQVDILPEESSRLKAELEEYIDPNDTEFETQQAVSTPLYQGDEASLKPIYNGENIVTGSTLEPISDESGLETIPLAVSQTDTAAHPPLKKSAKEPAPASMGSWFIQAGAFGNKANVDKALNVLGQFIPVSTTEIGRLTAVRVGPFATKAEAEKFLEKVRQAGYQDALVKEIK